MQNTKKTKYPSSVNGLQCLGPCYKPGTDMLHPITLTYMTNKDNPFCAVSKWIKKDENTGKKLVEYIDTCAVPTQSKNIKNKDLELNIIMPHIDFNCEQFLKIYYDIFSFEDSMAWLDKHDHVSINNKSRIVDCTLSKYGLNLNDSIDLRLITFFIKYLETKYINIIYKNINKYITIDNNNNNVYLIIPDNNELLENEYIVQRTNYIIDTFLQTDDMEKYIKKFISHNYKNWNNIMSHIEKMKTDFIDYVNNKIKKTLQINVIDKKIDIDK